MITRRGVLTIGCVAMVVACASSEGRANDGGCTKEIQGTAPAAPAHACTETLSGWWMLTNRFEQVSAKRCSADWLEALQVGATSRALANDALSTWEETWFHDSQMRGHGYDSVEVTDDCSTISLTMIHTNENSGFSLVAVRTLALQEDGSLEGSLYTAFVATDDLDEGPMTSKAMCSTTYKSTATR